MRPESTDLQPRRSNKPSRLKENEKGRAIEVEVDSEEEVVVVAYSAHFATNLAIRKMIAGARRDKQNLQKNQKNKMIICS